MRINIVKNYRISEVKMKIISWNVNGLRACVRKGFMDFFDNINADIFCVQEIKMQPGQLELQLPGYYQYLNSAEKKGYSGTAVFTKIKPLSIIYDIGIEEHSYEGRVITLEYNNFYLVNVYTPNAQEGLARIEYRMRWEDDFREYLKGLDSNKPVIVCGDMNVAHNEIDLKNPKSNSGNAGFSDEERSKMTGLLSAGFIDTFRWFYPDREEAYTWWSYRFNARANNTGWRIDYFLVSERLIPKIEDSIIYPEVLGSDHCPIGLLVSDSIQNTTKDSMQDSMQELIQNTMQDLTQDSTQEPIQNEPTKTAQPKTAQPKTIQRETTQSAVVQREAEQSETEQSETAKPEIAQPEEDSYEIYVDGSYINNNVGYGVVILKNGELLKEISGCVTDPVFTGSRQVGGEITAVMEALAWSKREKISKVTIFYDLENLKKWATGEYSANIPMSKAYRDFIQSSGVSVQWNKVAAHSGVKWNERADELAKKGTAESVKNNKEAPDLIKELEETAERFALYLEDNGYIAEFLRIYNKMSAKICIEKDGELLGYIDIYNTKKLHLQPRYHEIKEDNVREEMERLWETFRKSEKI
jgi:exodeoxyribonuclease-3